MKTLLLTLLLVLSLTAPGWAAPVIWDTTRFIQDGTYPYTDPEEDYKSHTSGVAVFLSATPSWWPSLPDEPDAIRWVHHFTPPPSSSITAARLLITLDDDDYTDSDWSSPEWGHLSIEGYWTKPDDTFLLNPLGTFEVDDGTYAFTLSQTKISWLYSGTLDCVFYAEQGDFYIVRSDLEMTLADQPTPDPNAVPEPATVLLLGSALIGLVGLRRKFE